MRKIVAMCVFLCVMTVWVWCDEDDGEAKAIQGNTTETLKKDRQDTATSAEIKKTKKEKRPVVWPYQTLGIMVGGKYSDELMLSVSAVYLVGKGGIELYYRTNHKEHKQGDEDYYTVMDYHWSENIGHELVKTEMSSTVIGISYVRNAYRGLYFKAGVGYVEAQEYRTYFDDHYILANDGNYIVDGKEYNEAISVNFGFMLRGPKVLFSIEYDSFPSGAVAMIGLTF